MRRSIRFDLVAKSGYGARGIVFLLVAVLALFSGFAGGRPETKTALAALLEQPFGRIWVGLIGVGLIGFVIWRLSQSLADSDGHGAGPKAIAIRSALFGSAVTYLGLAFYSLGQAITVHSDGGGSGEKGLAQWVMSQPFGPSLAIGIGIGFIAGGIVTAAKGLTRRFERYLNLPDKKGLVALICIYGLVARGVLFAVVGFLFAYAGFSVDPEKAGSMGDALEWVHRLPFGSILYVAAAAGLAAFGLYNLVEARYRIVRGPSLSRLNEVLPGRQG